MKTILGLLEECLLLIPPLLRLEMAPVTKSDTYQCYCIRMGWNKIINFLQEKCSHLNSNIRNQMKNHNAAMQDADE